MTNHKFDEKLLEKLADAVNYIQEIKASALQALCLAKDSELLKQEAKIDELTLKLREIHMTSYRSPPKPSIGTQASSALNSSSDEILNLQKEKQTLTKKIEELEKNLFKSELKCVELNQMIKSCYNEVELFTEPDDSSGKNKHRVISVLETEFKSKHRSSSQEEKFVPQSPSNKLSLMNFINYKSKLAEVAKTPTQKHSVGAYNFQSAGKKKFQSPVPRYF